MLLRTTALGEPQKHRSRELEGRWFRSQRLAAQEQNLAHMMFPMILNLLSMLGASL